MIGKSFGIWKVYVWKKQTLNSWDLILIKYHTFQEHILLKTFLNPIEDIFNKSVCWFWNQLPTSNKFHFKDLLDFGINLKRVRTFSLYPCDWIEGEMLNRNLETNQSNNGIIEDKFFLTSLTFFNEDFTAFLWFFFLEYLLAFSHSGNFCLRGINK